MKPGARIRGNRVVLFKKDILSFTFAKVYVSYIGETFSKIS